MKGSIRRKAMGMLLFVAIAGIALPGSIFFYGRITTANTGCFLPGWCCLLPGAPVIIPAVIKCSLLLFFLFLLRVALTAVGSAIGAIAARGLGAGHQGASQNECADQQDVLHRSLF